MVIKREILKIEVSPMGGCPPSLLSGNSRPTSAACVRFVVWCWTTVMVCFVSTTILRISFLVENRKLYVILYCFRLLELIAFFPYLLIRRWPMTVWISFKWNNQQHITNLLWLSLRMHNEGNIRLIMVKRNYKCLSNILFFFKKIFEMSQVDSWQFQLVSLGKWYCSRVQFIVQWTRKYLNRIFVFKRWSG